MKKYKLGELINVTRGMSLPGDKYAESGDLIRLTLGNFNLQGNGFKLNTSKTDLYYTGSVKKEFIMNKGDIITPLTEQTYGLLGSTARIPESGKYIQSQDVALIRSKSDKLYEDFCYYLISSPSVRKQLGAAAQQTKIRHTSPDKIKDCEVIIPEDVNQQIKITNLLNTIENKIALNNKTNTELENMAKTIYDYWFTQFDFPDKKGNPYKSSGGQMVYNETLKREIPAGWEVENIFNCADVLYGFPFSTEPFDEDIENSTKPHNVIRIRDIQDNSFSAKTDEEISSNYKTKIGDLLIGMDGNFHMNFWNREGDFVNQRIVRVREVDISTMLIYFQIKPYIKARETNVARSTVGHLSDKDMKSLNILIPSDKKINEYFNTVLSNICKNRNENEELIKLRDYLLPLLMNGQIEVK